MRNIGNVVYRKVSRVQIPPPPPAHSILISLKMSMSPEQSGDKPDETTIAQARMDILFTRQQILLLGANDRENAAIEEILRKLEVGKILPEDATQEAGKILSSKNDYH